MGKSVIVRDLGKNPFSTSLVIPVVNATLDSYKSDGEDLVPAVQRLEKDEFCKFYCSAERRLLVNKISVRGKELLLWILYELKYGEDFIRLNKVRYMKENGVSSINTYKEALKDLIRNGVLASTVENDIYWINPALFFKGSRVNKFPKNVIEYGSY